jgi:hypothetical protein
LIWCFQIAFGFFAPADEGKGALGCNGNVSFLFPWEVATGLDMNYRLFFFLYIPNLFSFMSGYVMFLWVGI